MSDGRRRTGRYPGLDIAVLLNAEGWDAVMAADGEPFVRRAVEAAATAAVLPPETECELAVSFSDDRQVRELNREWRGQDKPTNVLSFPPRPIRPGERPGPLLGDIVLALETCRREAEEEGKPVRDHLAHLLVHGALHLLGYDHGDDAQAERMERLEVSALAAIGIRNPYEFGEAVE